MAVCEVCMCAALNYNGIQGTVTRSAHCVQSTSKLDDLEVFQVFSVQPTSNTSHTENQTQQLTSVHATMSGL